MIQHIFIVKSASKRSSLTEIDTRPTNVYIN